MARRSLALCPAPRSAHLTLSSLLASPLLIGFLLGLCLHLLLPPHLHDDAHTPTEPPVQAAGPGPQQQQDVPAPIPVAQQESPVVRPRFVREEMNLTRRVLVAVWGGAPSQSYEALYNSSVELSGSAELGEVVFLPATNPLDLLEQLEPRLVNYQLLLLLPHTTVPRAAVVASLTSQVAASASGQVYRGVEVAGAGGRCDLHSGLLLGSALVRAGLAELAWCRRNSPAWDSALALHTCLGRAGAQCSHWHGYTVTPVTQPDQAAAVITGLDSEQQRRTVLAMVNRELGQQLKEGVVGLEAAVAELHNSARPPLEGAPPPWPPASLPPLRSTDRFDMDVWRRSNGTHEFGREEGVAASPLSAREVGAGSALAGRCGSGEWGYQAWTRVDHTRGEDRILLGQASPGAECRVVRELALPYIVPMPFVTESFKLSLILPVSEKDSIQTMSLLRSFARTAGQEKGDKLFLMLVFLYSPDRPDKNNQNDFFKDVKQLALSISKKYKKAGQQGTKAVSNLLWYSLQTRGQQPTARQLMDLVTQKLDNKTIVLLGSPDMEIRTDYFNRVRMNTLQGRQVFCPVPFTEFHPTVVYGTNNQPPSSLPFNTRYTTQLYSTINDNSLSSIQLLALRYNNVH